MDNYRLKEEILGKYFNKYNLTLDNFNSPEEAMEGVLGEYLYENAAEKIDLNEINEWLDSK